MASLAWTLKAWFALSLPVTGRWATKYARQKRKVLSMEFKTFLNAMMNVPCQIVRAGRRIVYRLLAWNPWQEVFLRGVDALYATVDAGIVHPDEKIATHRMAFGRLGS